MVCGQNVSVLGKLVAVVAVFVFASGAVSAQSTNTDQQAESAGNFQLSVGVKLHSNRVSGDGAAPVETLNGRVVPAEGLRTDSELSYIPVISARYRDFFVSASHLAKTNYSFTLPEGPRLNFDRSETDVNFGYYVLPGLALSLGYKEISVYPRSGLGNDYRYKGPTVGLLGYGPLGHGFGIYGNLAYGKLNLSPTDGIEAGKRNTYVASEVGFAYSWDFRESSRLLKSVNVTFGFRNQTVETDNPVSVASTQLTPSGFIVTGTGKKHLENTSRGPVLGVIISF